MVLSYTIIHRVGWMDHPLLMHLVSAVVAVDSSHMTSSTLTVTVTEKFN